MHVGDVQFDDWHAGTLDRVVQRNRRVRVGARIHHDTEHAVGCHLAAGLVNPVDQLAFVIRLPALDLDAKLRAGIGTQALDIGQRFMTVLGRLAGAEQVQIGAVEYKDFFHEKSLWCRAIL